MTVIEISIFINRSPEDITDFTAYQPERLPEWFEGVETVEWDDNYPEVGSQLKVTYKAAGLTLHTTGTVVEFIPGEKYVAQYEGMASGLQTWTYTPENGGTHITLHFDYEMGGGGLGKIADKLIVERQNTRNFEQSLANLKAWLEG
ncbi:MAG: SRPBCC family protein [Anaerolineae bacterium]|nr:SRPBCC family protein [Anaerolineae bacterium]